MIVTRCLTDDEATMRMNIKIQFIGIPLLLTMFLAAVLVMVSASCSRQPSYTSPPLAGTNAVIDLSGLKLEVPQFYTYNYHNKPISFFVVKLNDKVLAFFDACASCYPHKQGYRYEDGCVTCRQCSMRFPLYKLEKGFGGCYPIKIEGRVENGKYLIPVAMIEAAEDKF